MCGLGGYQCEIFSTCFLFFSADMASPSYIRAHTTVDYLHCLVPRLTDITSCGFYWGVMDRYEAEALLDNRPEGTFLLRDSSQVRQTSYSAGLTAPARQHWPASAGPSALRRWC